MLAHLSDDSATAEAVRRSIGKTIASVTVDGDRLVIAFDSKDSLSLFDSGQSCCENRYLTCGDLDNAEYYKGATLVGIELRDAPAAENEYDIHEVQFLLVTTSKGVITAETHNEHNGYYGGFAVEAVYEAAL